MRKYRLYVFLFVCLLAAGQRRGFAQLNCSTEVVNPDCTVHIDRNYPITLPTLQMRRGAKVTVVVDNPLAFESLTLDPQSTQAVIGSDQTSTFLTAAAPSMKSIFTGSQSRVIAIAAYSQINISGLNLSSPDSQTMKKTLSDIQNALKSLTTDVTNAANNLSQDYATLSALATDVPQVYLQLQEITSPLPRPITTVNGTYVVVRPAQIMNSTPHFPDPWRNYGAWRQVLLLELTGRECDDSFKDTCAAFPIKDLLGTAAKLKAQWTAGTDCDSSPGGDKCPYPAFPSGKLKAEADAIQSQIDDAAALNTPPDPVVTVTLDRFERNLKKKSTEIDAIAATILASQTVATDAEIDVLTKDLNQYAANIYLAPPATTASIGSVYDPIVDPNDQKRKVIATLSKSDVRRLGRQAVFAVDAVNLVSNSAAFLPAATAKKAIATITVVYADPIFETSAGTFFSFIPNRSFSNQTNIGQNPDGSMTGCATGSNPIYCSITISEQDKKPTVVPFVGANWRLGHDFLWLDSRRGATYFTAALGINPNSATTEYAAGFSLSWRALMLSPLYHLGRDSHLTQGETVGEVLCYYDPPTTGVAIDKCGSPSTPSPATKPYWRGAFAIGLSVRIPSIFSSSGH